MIKNAINYFWSSEPKINSTDYYQQIVMLDFHGGYDCNIF